MKRWYIVTTYSGYEDSVKQDLERRRESMNMQDQIHQILVPEVTEIVTDKKGNKKEKVSKLYPGYVFVELEVEGEMDNELWFNVRNTPKVTGFLGSSGGGTKPVPVQRGEMDEILKKLGLVTKQAFDIEVGDVVEITSGPFTGQIAEVSAVNEEKEIVTVLVEMFGRNTPSEEAFSHVKKISGPKKAD